MQGSVMGASSRAVTVVFILSLAWAALRSPQGWARPAQPLNTTIRTATGVTATEATPTEAAQAIAGGVLAGGVLKEIDDSCTGDQWLLVRDANHPAGPGRLVRITPTGRMVPPVEALKTVQDLREQAAVPIIHTGDVLVLEESTPLVEARLEARALGPAICGAEFNARLTIGGKIVRAVALGKGRAAFASVAGMKP